MDQNVMFQDATGKQWFLATITSLCSQPRSYKITTKEGVTYRKTKVHFKPYIPQSKNEDKHSLLQLSDMWTFNLITRSLIQLKIKYNIILSQRGALTAWLSLICKGISEYFDNRLDLA